jgi:hypothetical protein
METLFSFFFFFLLHFKTYKLLQTTNPPLRSYLSDHPFVEEEEEERWVVERSRSRGLRTRQTGKSPTPSEEMVFSRKLRSSPFFVMLRSRSSCSLVLTSSTSTLAPPFRKLTNLSLYLSLFSLILLFCDKRNPNMIKFVLGF